MKNQQFFLPFLSPRSSERHSISEVSAHFRFVEIWKSGQKCCFRIFIFVESKEITRLYIDLCHVPIRIDPAAGPLSFPHRRLEVKDNNPDKATAMAPCSSTAGRCLYNHHAEHHKVWLSGGSFQLVGRFSQCEKKEMTKPTQGIH